MNLVEIYNILAAEKGFERTMGDVLRVLGLYHRLWLSEIYVEIKGMNTTLREDIPEYSDIVKAVNELKNKGYVYVEKRTRSSLASTEGVEDYLVSLAGLREVVLALLSDRKLVDYVKIKRSMFR
ncbi:MAG: hypothetical protein DRO13_00235 [Thermoprotei archaeon]|nr:MAG: hypothetical protein DRO13_00030 [Thermoprotei archaeon]RLG81828.1 MAG: hypothetical protein DRO13_00235 [Thermoprotei archaeon]